MVSVTNKSHLKMMLGRQAFHFGTWPIFKGHDSVREGTANGFVFIPANSKIKRDFSSEDEE